MMYVGHLFIYIATAGNYSYIKILMDYSSLVPNPYLPVKKLCYHAVINYVQ